MLVGGSVGILAVAAATLALLPARGTVAAPLLVALGAGLMVAGLNAAGVGAGANAFEALLAAAAGLLLARVLGAPAVAVAVPMFVAAIDLYSVLTGPARRLLDSGGGVVDALSFALPAWGGGLAGRLGVSDAVFLAMFAAWAWDFGLRRRATIVAMVSGLVAALVLSVALDTAIPALPLLVAGYLLPNGDRLLDLLRGREGAPGAG
ncbi:MAG: hypothetical protein MSC31_06605 [Solirubrobacteraceae bacterium MAG38_C4-C5]|nr:hypothetical protein [Candidatus Siliceabacter maunaloa]